MKAHDPENPGECWCPECVCRNYPEVARRHPNCRRASEDVDYRKLMKEGFGPRFLGKPIEEEKAPWE